MSNQPIIILGMHRSGTTMITQFLEELGLFVGKKKYGTHEAVYFQRINKWMLAAANANWDCPRNFTLIDEAMSLYLEDVVRRYLRSIWQIEYLGITDYLKYRCIDNYPSLWGWKDPRNTFTVDIWRRVFPNCKVLHIYRNPVDVAYSMKRGRERQTENRKRTFGDSVREYLLWGKGRFQLSPRTGDLREGVELWKEYVKQALRLSDSFGSKVKHLRYEDFLEKPFEYLSEIVEFIGLEAEPQKVKAVVKAVRNDRRYSFLNNHELLSCYHAIHLDPLVKALGYSELLTRHVSPEMQGRASCDGRGLVTE